MWTSPTVTTQQQQFINSKIKLPFSTYLLPDAAYLPNQSKGETILVKDLNNIYISGLSNYLSNFLTGEL